MPSASPDIVSTLSGALPGWSPGRPGVPARPVFFAHATRTASYKNDNDDAVFVERLPDGMVVAGLFDGVTVPKRNNRSGHAVCAYVRDRLKVTLVERDGRRPVVETVVAAALQESVALLEKAGGGAATTATVLVGMAMPTGSWRLYVINAGNSRATVFLPDGTLEPITRIKPPGTPFAAVNTLSQGYAYKLESTRATVPPGTLVLLTSDGIHDHVPDTAIWGGLGSAVQAVLNGNGAGQTGGLLQRLARGFADVVVERAVRAQERAHLSDDSTALALLLDAPVATLEQKRRSDTAPADGAPEAQ
jgi:serine/threonine protein phosphatase PrpC